MSLRPFAIERVWFDMYPHAACRITNSDESALRDSLTLWIVPNNATPGPGMECYVVEVANAELVSRGRDPYSLVEAIMERIEAVVPARLLWKPKKRAVQSRDAAYVVSCPCCAAPLQGYPKRCEYCDAPIRWERAAG